MIDAVIAIIIGAILFCAGVGAGVSANEEERVQACETHCAPYAIDESADICQCQQVSPAVVAEDCGQ